MVDGGCVGKYWGGGEGRRRESRRREEGRGKEECELTADECGCLLLLAAVAAGPEAFFTAH